MRHNLSLHTNLYPRVTPAGAYYAVFNNIDSPSRTLLCSLLKAKKKVPVNQQQLLEWCKTNDADAALNLLYRLQKLEFLYGSPVPSDYGDTPLEKRLPEILVQLSETGKALLANDNGLYFAAAGFHHESAEEVAALAGEIIRLSEQHALLIKNNLNINQNAWSICDPAGQSHLAFFPMYFGEYKFVLVIAGAPQLQNEAFVEMVELLYRRYGS